MTLVNGLKAYLAFEADLTALPSTWTLTDVTSFVLLDADGVTIDVGYPEGSDEPATVHVGLTVDNTDGRWSTGKIDGAWFGRLRRGIPLVIKFDPGTGEVSRATVYLGDLPQEWTPGGIWQTVRIDAYGLLAREDSTSTPESFIRRTVLRLDDLITYVPCEDASGATTLAQLVAGQPNAQISGVTPAGDSGWGGSKPVATVTPTSTVAITVNPYARPTPEAWQVGMGVRVPAKPAVTGEVAIGVVCNTGAVRRWVFELSSATPSVLKLKGYDASGAELLGDTGLALNTVSSWATTEPFDEQWALEIRAQQNGTGIDWRWVLWHTTSSIGYATTGTLASSTLGPINALGTGPNATLDGASVCHYHAVANADTGGLAGSTIAFGGFEDTTGVRFDFALPGSYAQALDSNGPTTMGFVDVDSPLNILRSAATLDGGVWYEGPDGVVHLRSLTVMVNQSVALTVPYGHLQNLRPTDPIRDLINRVTMTRDGGGSATADATGPYSPQAITVARAKSVTVDAETDANLRYYAQWAAAIGATPDYRYVLEMWMHAGASSHLADWLPVKIGQRIQVTSPPSWMPPDTIDVYLRGYQERISRLRYEVTARTLSYLPYQVFTVAGTGNTGRADTSGCKLLAAVTNSDTSAIVGTYGNPGEKTGVAVKWSTGSVPYDIGLRRAERCTVTAVANNAPTFVNVGAASHGDNATLTPALAAGLTVGDLMLCVAAIRNTAAYPVTPTGWARSPMFGKTENVALFTKQYVAGDAAPSIAFTGGSAGDTTSAQCAAFRYLQATDLYGNPIVHNRVLRLSNASAANITTPDLGVVRDGCVILLVGWKQDDWTSSAPPAGFTEIGEPSSTTGNDQAFTWAYLIQTTATRVAASSFVITGGASAISKCGAAALLGDVQTLTLTRAVNGTGIAHAYGTEVKLWRAGVVSRP